MLLTLFGALPVYSQVAKESPHGEGSIAMLESLLSRWKGKLFVLVLLGFVATDFVITITLSAADASAHALENPFVQNRFPFLEHPMVITVILISLLGAVFIRGFKEAIGIAVVLVTVYLFLNRRDDRCRAVSRLFRTRRCLATGKRLFGTRPAHGARRDCSSF